MMFKVGGREKPHLKSNPNFLRSAGVKKSVGQRLEMPKFRTQVLPFIPGAWEFAFTSRSELHAPF